MSTVTAIAIASVPATDVSIATAAAVGHLPC